MSNLTPREIRLQCIQRIQLRDQVLVSLYGDELFTALLQLATVVGIAGYTPHMDLSFLLGAKVGDSNFPNWTRRSAQAAISNTIGRYLPDAEIQLFPYFRWIGVSPISAIHKFQSSHIGV